MRPREYLFANMCHAADFRGNQRGNDLSVLPTPLPGNLVNEDVCNGTDVTQCNDGSGKCFQRETICVYERLQGQIIAGCPSGAHLQNCLDFQCPHMLKCEIDVGYCIPFKYVCDSIPDCPSNQDEKNHQVLRLAQECLNAEWRKNAYIQGTKVMES